MRTKVEVAVVGLGAMGAATLYQLARRRVRAMGIDQYSPPHVFGSSHGETRITRQAVGEGAAYVPLVLRSHQIWRELEKRTGRRLLVQCGGVIIGPLETKAEHHQKVAFLRSTIELARRFGIEHEVLPSEELRRRFPQFEAGTNDVGYYENGAGFLYPETCIEVQLSEAERLGASILRKTKVLTVSQDSEVVRIETDFEVIEASRIVVAVGAWTASLLGAPFDKLLRVYRQVLHWFTPEEPRLYSSIRCPIFIRMHGQANNDYFYGFPTPEGATGVKVATELYPDDKVEVDRLNRQVSEEEIDRIFNNHIAGRLKGMTRRTARPSTVCLYTNTPDSHFLIDNHPAMPRVSIVSACSGHGFKHSAAIGEAIAEEIGSSELLRPFRLESLNQRTFA